MISPAEAEAAIRTNVPRLAPVTLPLTAVCGAILRETAIGTRDQPPFDRVTMDGIALSYDAYAGGRTSFRIAATQAAGAAPLTLREPGDCIEIMTGAMLPTGCDCVIPVEDIVVADGVARLRDSAKPERNSNIHARGIDSRRGDVLLPAGSKLGPAEVAVLASNGQTHATVSRTPRIMVVSTGDELVEPGNPLEDWQIHRSNVYGVLAALRSHGYTELSQDHVPDDLETLRTRLRAHLDAYDALILSGGVSMGRFDYIPQVLQELGVRVIFHKIAQRPGKPMWFGVGSGGQAVYALPGNPVSTLVCLTRYVLPGLQAAQGAGALTNEMADETTSPETIPLAESYEVKPALTLFVPVKILQDQASRRAALRPTRGSGDFTSLIGTDGFVQLPPGPRVVAAGSRLSLYRW